MLALLLLFKQNVLMSFTFTKLKKGFMGDLNNSSNSNTLCIHVCIRTCHTRGIGSEVVLSLKKKKYQK